MSIPAGHAKEQLQRAWEHPSTPATVLLAMYLDAFDSEATDWEPEVMREAIESGFNVKPPLANYHKLLALITCITSDTPYQDVASFHHVVNALNDSVPLLEDWDPLDTAELTWAVTEMLLNNQPPQGTSTVDMFSIDVRRYIGIILSDEYVYTPPGILEPIADYPGKPHEDVGTDGGLVETAVANGNLVRQEAEDYARAKLEDVTELLRQLPLVGRQAPASRTSGDRTRPDGMPSMSLP